MGRYKRSFESDQRLATQDRLREIILEHAYSVSSADPASFLNSLKVYIESQESYIGMHAYEIERMYEKLYELTDPQRTKSQRDMLLFVVVSTLIKTFQDGYVKGRNLDNEA